MKLYLLKRKCKFGYDTYDGFVVRAISSANARKLVHELTGKGSYSEKIFGTVH